MNIFLHFDNNKVELEKSLDLRNHPAQWASSFTVLYESAGNPSSPLLAKLLI